MRDLFERHQAGDAALPQPLDYLRSPVLLIVSLFDGIGGIRRAAERLRLSVPLYLSAEMCAKARRVVRACWPGVIEYDDVRQLTRSIIFALVAQAAEIGVTLVIVSGGWPCQDVSLLNKCRVGVEGSRSSLFREFIRISALCAEAAAEQQLRFAGLGECTRMSLADQERISNELGWVRTEVCSSGSSRVNRPRNYWTMPTLQGGEGFEVWPDATGQRGRLSGPLEPSFAWVLPDWEWRPGDASQIRLPTFTRAIPRSRPPPGAPGLYEADSETLQRYFGDDAGLKCGWARSTSSSVKSRSVEPYRGSVYLPSAHSGMRPWTTSRAVSASVRKPWDSLPYPPFGSAACMDSAARWWPSTHWRKARSFAVVGGVMPIERAR